MTTRTRWKTTMKLKRKLKNQVIATHASNWSCYKRFDYMFRGTTKINGAFHPFLSPNCQGELSDDEIILETQE